MNLKIPIERLAEKFAAAYHCPADRAAFAGLSRARELLLYLQAQSTGAGGLSAFVERFCQQFPHLIATPAMRGLSGKNKLSPAEKSSITRQIPQLSSHSMRERDRASDGQKWLNQHFWENVEHIQHGSYILNGFPKITLNQRFIDSLDLPYFQKLCADYARAFLPAQIFHVCTRFNRWFDDAWFCPDLPAALLQMMERDAAAVKDTIAETAVTRAVFDGIEFALARKCFVRIDGSSRFGKSESARAFAAMFPGKCRLVETDCLNSDKDFFGAIADALGLERDFRTSAISLRLRIDRIAAHSGLGFIFDEGHFLLNRTKRIDWIRTHLIERGCAVVIITTPQVYENAAKKLRAATGYNFDQVDGRIRRHIRLDENFNAADLLAIVRKKAAAFPSDWQHMIAAAARLVPGSYLAAVNAIVDITAWNAQRAGHTAPRLADLERAIEEVAPNAADHPEPIASEDETPPAPRRTRPAALQPSPAIARQITPSLAKV